MSGIWEKKYQGFGSLQPEKNYHLRRRQFFSDNYRANLDGGDAGRRHEMQRGEAHGREPRALEGHPFPPVGGQAGLLPRRRVA